MARIITRKGKRGTNTRNTDKYCDWKDCQKTHVFPADKKLQW